MLKRIVILSLGSRGDVEPFIALAAKLRTEGHDVVILALDDFRDAIASAGVAFTSMGARLPQPQRVSAAIDWAMAHAHRHQLIAVEGVQLWLRGIAANVADAIVGAVRPSDVVITGILTLDTALALRAALGCSVAVAVFAPCIPTRSGPSLIEAVRPERTSAVNLLGGVVTWLVGARWSRPSGLLVRHRLGLAPQSLRTMLPAALRAPILLAASPVLVPPAPDWPPRVWLTGSWATASRPDRIPPDDLVDFLHRRSAPLYVGFGSVGHPLDSQLFIDASRAARVRIVISPARGSTIETGALDEDIYVVGEIPHAWLFPRLAGVIHHGSAGTTATALRAGVPSTAVPHQFDQRYYARRLSLLTVGPPAIPRRRLDRNRLTNLMTAMTSGPAAAEYQRRARAIAETAVVEVGTTEALRVLRREHIL